MLARVRQPDNAYVCTVPLIVARRVDGIDSMTNGHWPIAFRRNTFARVQRSSEDDDLPTQAGGR
jgi:hypothetical protein